MVLCGSEDAKSENDGLAYAQKSVDKLSLTTELTRHLEQETASFHTPGHKGRPVQSASLPGTGEFIRFDLTELPGLDDLSNPVGVLANLESRLDTIFGAKHSSISCNGASAGIVAAMLYMARRGSTVLVPQNCHRSMVNGLVLSGLMPIWYEPKWESDWGLWGAVEPSSLGQALDREFEKTGKAPAAVCLVSPTYAGALSDIKAIAQICHGRDVPLVVDEAHGASLLLSDSGKYAALINGADIVIHSLHKQLGALTQTGAVHIGQNGVDQFGFTAAELRAYLNLIQSTSPSYLLLKSIDELATSFESGEEHQVLNRVATSALSFREEIGSVSDIELYEPKPAVSTFHLLLRSTTKPTGHLEKLLQAEGVFAETKLGNGLLLMLGRGSEDKDLATLKRVLRTNLSIIADEHAYRFPKAEPTEQIVTPRDAFFSPHKSVSIDAAVGMISGECLAPCPPGWPLLVPGQLITEEVAKTIKLDSLQIVNP